MSENQIGLIIGGSMAALCIALGISFYYGCQAKFSAIVFSILIEIFFVCGAIAVPLAWIEYFKSK